MAVVLASPVGAVVPPGGTPAPDCTGGAFAFPKRIWACGSNFPVWDSAFMFPRFGGSGFQVSGNVQLTSDYTSFFLLLDQAGNTVTRISPLQNSTTFSQMTSDTQFHAYRQDIDANETTFGVYSTQGSYAPVFQHKLALDPSKTTISVITGGKTLITSNGDTQIDMLVYNADGTLALAKRYSSSVFGVPGGGSIPTNTQSAFILPLSDGSFMLMVTQTEIDSMTFAVTAKSHLVKLSSAGAVEWAKTYEGVEAAASVFQLSGGGFVLSSSAADFLNPSAPRENVFTRINSSGTQQWSKKITSPLLTASSSLSSDRLILTGSTGSIGGGTSNALLAVLGSGGTLDAQIEYGADDLNFGSVSVEDTRLWIMMIAVDNPGGSGVTETLGPAYVGLTDPTLGSIQWMRYNKDVNFGLLSPDFESTQVSCSFFVKSTRSLEAFTFNDNFTVNATCSLFTNATVPTSNPGLTVADETITLTDITVTVADFTPAPTAGNLTFETLTVSEADLCASGGGGGGGSITLSAQSANSTTFGGSGSFNVTTSETYAVSSNQTWVTITAPSGGQGTGNGTVSYTVQPNASSTPRNATITVGTASFTVNQAGMSSQVEVNPSGAPTNLGVGTGSGSLSVLSQIAWTAIAESWIELAPGGSPVMSPLSFGSAAPGGGVFHANAVSGQAGLSTLQWSVTNGGPLDNRSGSIRIVDGSGNVLFTLNITQSGVGGVAPVNMSARTQVGIGGNILIPGFVIGGTGKTKILIRGVGPTLADFNVSGVLPDPRLLIYRDTPQGPVVVDQNDSWQSGPVNLVPLTAEVGGFDLTDPKDAGLYLDLDPGAYTAHLSGVGDTTGIGLVEIYVLDAAANRGLVNLSARAEVGADARVMIPGFVINGNQSVQVIVRGVGPTLTTLGVAGALADPLIEVFDSTNTSIALNDDWHTAANVSALLTATATVGAFDLDPGSADAALLLTLAPGSYTAHIRGKGSAIGVALLEVYFVRGL